MKTLLKDQTAIYLTDGGLETSFIFDQDMDLPHFAAFPLVETPRGQKLLADYYTPYLQLANQNNQNFILESCTYKANISTGYKLGYSQHDLDQVNQKAILQLIDLREKHGGNAHVLVSGCLGPAKDGYTFNGKLTAQEAQAFHLHQVKAFKAAGADMASAFTLNYIEEAIGFVNAAKETSLPAVVSFTVETDGKLIDGTRLSDAISAVDQATGQYAAYFMINCAHPSHFDDREFERSICRERLRAIRANASCKSHAELDESDELDNGDIPDLADQFKWLNEQLPNLQVHGGCCGTDIRHMTAIAGNMT